MAALVSIIVNNYNYGRFVGEAIDSALGQTYRNTEVIVVDDGSRDNSREVIAGYGSRIIPVLKENGGQGSAFNAGFAASRGEYVLFLDSDDLLEANAIETVMREWTEGAARVYFQLQAVGLRGEPLGRTIGGSATPSALLGPFVTPSSSGTVFSRQSLERIMPISEREWRICADYYLCAASSLFGATERIGQPLGKYRIHGQNNFQVGEPLAKVRNLINLNLKLHGSLSPLMTGGEIGSLEQWLGNSPEHWFRRIISLREGPRDHPWPDSIVGLTTRAVRAAWRRPGWRFRQRLACSIQAISYGLIPGKAQSLLSKY